MKTQTARPAEDPTEALLQGLIAECHAVIREVVVPGIRDAGDHHHRRLYIHSVTDLVESAAKLSDAIGRLRGTAPVPELHQKITVEKIQRLAAPAAKG